MRTLNLTLSLVLCVAATACQQAKNLDEMHGATMEMRDSTRDLNQTSHQMSTDVQRQVQISEDLGESVNTQLQVSNEMNDRLKTQIQYSDSLDRSTSELYDGLRQGNALTLRRDALDQMRSSRDMARKLSEGAKYFMSYEFQLWTGHGRDSGSTASSGDSTNASSGDNTEALRQREVLFQQATHEFFMDIQEFYVNSNSINVFAGQAHIPGANLFFGEERESNFNALAVSMDQNNRQQTVAAREFNVPVKSMYDLIKESLHQRRNPEEGVRVAGSSYVDEVLLQEDIAWRLMQARHNTYTAVILGQLSNIRDPLQFMRKSMGAWDLDISRLNPAQARLFSMYLAAAQETISFLQHEGRNVQVNNSLRALWRNARLNAVSVRAQPELSTRIQNYKRFLDTIR